MMDMANLLKISEAASLALHTMVYLAANLYLRWAVVQPMKERHPLDMGNPGSTGSPGAVQSDRCVGALRCAIESR